MFKQGIERFGLFIEKGTDRVPDDGKYYVMHQGATVIASNSEKRALKAYSELRAALLEAMGNVQEPPNTAETLRRERDARELYEVRADAFRRREQAARTKGGKGGRGGV